MIIAQKEYDKYPEDANTETGEDTEDRGNGDKDTKVVDFLCAIIREIIGSHWHLTGLFQARVEPGWNR